MVGIAGRGFLSSIWWGLPFSLHPLKGFLAIPPTAGSCCWPACSFRLTLSARFYDFSLTLLFRFLGLSSVLLQWQSDGLSQLPGWKSIHLCLAAQPIYMDRGLCVQLINLTPDQTKLLLCNKSATGKRRRLLKFEISSCKPRTGGLSAWIGYTDLDQDTHFQWSDNTQDTLTVSTYPISSTFLDCIEKALQGILLSSRFFADPATERLWKKPQLHSWWNDLVCPSTDCQDDFSNFAKNCTGRCLVCFIGLEDLDFPVLQ